MTNARQPVTGGLSLPKNTGVGSTEEQAVHQQWTTLDEQEEKLASQGFVPMDAPSFTCPEITEETLTTADSKAYSTTFAQQLSWFNYSSQTLARCIAELLQVSNEMDIIEAKMRRGFRERMKLAGKDGKMTAQEMSDEILLDARYSYLLLRKQELTQYKTRLAAYTDGIERGLKVISRQVEIRKMELEQSRVNIPGRDYRGPRTP